MDRQFTTEDIGEQLGMEGVGSVVSKVEAYCAYEEQRIALTNEPKIVALRAEASLLLDEERALTDRLNVAPPPGDLRSRRRKAFYYGCVTAFLTVAAFVFSLYSFEPFRLGLKGYLYCFGIAIVTPFLVDKVIEWWKAEMLIKSVATFACVAALASLVLLAVIRGDLMAESVKDSSPVIVVDDAQPQPPQSENNFYGRTTTLLQLVMILLAVAMELAAGLALHEVWRMKSDTTDDWDKLRTQLVGVRGRLVALAFEIKALQNEPRVFSARFWRNFYRAMLTHTLRSATTKLLMALVLTLVVAHSRVEAQTHTMLVIAVDLTQSVAVRGPDGKSEFRKNIEAVTKQLAQMPADSSVTVIGITDHSFTQPLILLSAAIPADPGYFGQRLNDARKQLIHAWKSRSAKLVPSYPLTDIFGALLLAEQIFDKHGNTASKMLLIYSDMRQSTPQLDMEKSAHLPSFSQVSNRSHVADLHHVRVLVLGVDGSNRSIASWRLIRKFWVDYFRASGTTVEAYSVLR